MYRGEEQKTGWIKSRLWDFASSRVSRRRVFVRNAHYGRTARVQRGKERERERKRGRKEERKDRRTSFERTTAYTPRGWTRKRALNWSRYDASKEKGNETHAAGWKAVASREKRRSERTSGNGDEKRGGKIHDTVLLSWDDEKASGTRRVSSFLRL